MKKLYRNTKDKMFAGVLAGLADYFDHDVTLWRLAFVFLTIVTGVVPGVITYVLAWIIIPQSTTVHSNGDTVIHDV